MYDPMGERNTRLIRAITDPEVNRYAILRVFGLTQQELDSFIERNRKKITFEKIKRSANA